MRLLDTETADRDLTATVTVLTHTPSTTKPKRCVASVLLGDGTDNLSGVGGNFELTIQIGSYVLQPGPKTIAFGSATRAQLDSDPFDVPANAAVLVKVKSPNGADSNVGVTAYLYDVGSQMPEDVQNVQQLLVLDDGSAFAFYESGANIYFRVFNAAGLVYDFTAKQFVAIGSTANDYIGATALAAIGGTGYSGYRAALDLAEIHSAGDVLPLVLCAFNNAAPADGDTMIMPPAEFAVQFGELAAAPITVHADVSVKSTEGDTAQLKVWIDRESQRMDVAAAGGEIFTADAGTDVITDVAHGLSDGDVLLLSTSNTLPAGLATGTPYFVRDKTADTFKLAATLGGAAINITSAGTGVHKWHKPTARLRLREHGADLGTLLFDEDFDATHLVDNVFEKELSNPGFVTDRQYDALAEVSENGNTHSSYTLIVVM